METRHTPGPWSVDWAIAPVGGSPQVVEYFVRRDGDSVAIASDIVDPDTGVRSAENARLIAAAPELLAALQVLVENGGIGSEQMFRDARAAISKALG